MAEYDDPEEQKATFAQRFIQTGNLDQRRRFAQDISESKARNDERMAQEFENLQIRKPEVGRLMLAREREDRQAMEGRARLGMEKARFERQLGRDVTMDDLAQRRLRLQQNTEKRLLRQEALELDKIDKEEEDTLGFQEAEMQLRDMFGVRSKGYRDGLLDAAISFPHMNKELRQYALKESGFEDPDTAVAQASDLMSKNPDITRQTVKTPSGTVTMVKPKPDKTLNKAKTELDRVRVLWDRAKQKGDPSTVEYFESRIRELEPLTQGTSAPSPATPGPAPTAPVQPGTRPPLAELFK